MSNSNPYPVLFVHIYKSSWQHLWHFLTFDRLSVSRSSTKLVRHPKKQYNSSCNVPKSNSYLTLWSSQHPVDTHFSNPMFSSTTTRLGAYYSLRSTHNPCGDPRRSDLPCSRFFFRQSLLPQGVPQVKWVGVLPLFHCCCRRCGRTRETRRSSLL